jgi:hypothetical protein
MVETARLAFVHTNGTFLKFLGIVAAAIFFLTYPPPSWILEVDGISVEDTPAGTTPVMRVDRTIHRDFAGEWTVTVMKKGQRGFYAFCTARGANDYRTDAELPDDLDLDWWTWPTKCALPAGTYKLKTLWVIHLPIFPDKEVRATSNVFEVR